MAFGELILTVDMEEQFGAKNRCLTMYPDYFSKRSSNIRLLFIFFVHLVDVSNQTCVIDLVQAPCFRFPDLSLEVLLQFVSNLSYFQIRRAYS